MTMAPSSNKTMDSNKVLEGSPDCRNQLGLKRKHRLLTSVLSTEAAQPTDINMASDDNPDHQHPYGLKW